jgi:hypothetical protein
MKITESRFGRMGLILVVAVVGFFLLRNFGMLFYMLIAVAIGYLVRVIISSREKPLEIPVDERLKLFAESNMPEELQDVPFFLESGGKVGVLKGYGELGFENQIYSLVSVERGGGGFSKNKVNIVFPKPLLEKKLGVWIVKASALMPISKKTFGLNTAPLKEALEMYKGQYDQELSMYILEKSGELVSKALDANQTVQIMNSIDRRVIKIPGGAISELPLSQEGNSLANRTDITQQIKK